MRAIGFDLQDIWCKWNAERMAITELAAMVERCDMSNMAHAGLVDAPMFLTFMTNVADRLESDAIRIRAVVAQFSPKEETSEAGL